MKKLLLIAGLMLMWVTPVAAHATEPPPLSVKWYPEEPGVDVYIERNQTEGGFIRLRWADSLTPTFTWEWSPTGGGLANYGECFQDLGVRYVKATKTLGAHYAEEASEKDCIPPYEG